MKNQITETVPFWGDLDRRKAAFLRTELSDISSLIADMACNGATETELASAINHSANVIGIMKNCIDLIKKSECENEISELRQKYQLVRRNRDFHSFDEEE